MRPRLRAGLALLLAFVAGVATALVIVNIGLSRRHALPPPMPLYKLGLDDAQTREIRAIMDRRRPELEAVIEPVRATLRQLHDDVEAEIREVLTPAQRDALERLKREGAPPPPLPLGDR